ncbi:MAG TPA: AraC family transcriptional regulator, partial [Phycisphaerae bacterium]|nr:AraC family transcriptional regulator [Phycisphaerae bacterium]
MARDSGGTPGGTQGGAGSGGAGSGGEGSCMRGLCGRVPVAHKSARARWLNAPERRRRAGQR